MEIALFPALYSLYRLRSTPRNGGGALSRSSFASFPTPRAFLEHVDGLCACGRMPTPRD